MRLLSQYRPELAKPEAEAVAELAEGSIGRAIELADAGGLALYRSLLEPAVADFPRVDIAQLYAFVDKLARPEAERYLPGG